MGETKTQKRTLDAVYPVKDGAFGSSATPGTEPLNWTPYPWGKGLLPSTTQETTSYRSTSWEDPLSDANVQEFTDVTRNGFTEPLERVLTDNGHEFYTTRTDWGHFSHSDIRRYVRNTKGTYDWYQGPLIPLIKSGTALFAPAVKMTDSDIRHYGSKAIAASAPTQPGVSVTTAIGELIADGLPKLFGLDTLQGRTSRVRSAGGEYLNVEFGWKPLVNDIVGVAMQLSEAGKLIRQFERDGGLAVRRAWHAPQEVSTEVVSDVASLGNTVALQYFAGSSTTRGFFQGPGAVAPHQVSMETTSSTRISFKGRFKYAVIKGHTFGEKLLEYEQKANILLGTRITPEVLWNLAPWSWMADWAGNFGDIISNATYFSSDGLVMEYGYLMRETRAVRRFQTTTDAVFVGGANVGPVHFSTVRTTKERYKATPYGFGLTPGSLNPRQWAILAALGITRAPGRLP